MGVSDEQNRLEQMRERERRLDQIRKTADQLGELAKRYQRLQWLAEKDTASDAFIALAETCGLMTTCSLRQLGATMESLWAAQEKVGGDRE
jgi:hypothetical protein